VVGQIKFNLTFIQSRLYAEQMDCLVLSENGIVMISPGEENLREKVLDWEVIQALERRLHKLKKHGAGEMELYRLLEDIYTFTIDK